MKAALPPFSTEVSSRGIAMIHPVSCALPARRSAAHPLQHRGAECRRRGRDRDAGRAHRLHLVSRTALAAGDDGSGMAHPPSGRGRHAGDEPHHRLLGLGLLQEGGGVFFGSAADLADHDDAFGLAVGEEQLEHIDEIGAVDRIAADADAGGLAEPGRGGLGHRLIGKRAGARHNTDAATAMDMARHDADLAGVGSDHARAVGADEPGLRAGQRPLDAHHVDHRNAFRDADDEPQLGIDRFENGVGRERRRHVDDARIGAGLVDRLMDGVEHRQIEMLAAAFAGRDAADHLGAVGDRLLGMEGALGAGEALADHLGVLIDENRHHTDSFTAATTFWAASARSLPETMGRPDWARIFLPSSTLVPSSRTTSGTCRLTSRAAAMMPSAMTSHRMMPPKMLTRMPSTFSSDRMILKAAVTRSLVAPPPTSRKLAGAPPYSLMMSMVAIARPAPFTMQPILPSSAT